MVNPRRKALAFFLACVMLLSLLPISALAADADGIRMDVAEGNTPGSRCPDFTFTTYDGKEYNLYDTLAEKDMVLINLWATWCGPCQSEFPAMTEAYGHPGSGHLLPGHVYPHHHRGRPPRHHLLL